MARSGWTGKSQSYRSRLIGAGRSGKLTGTSLTPEETRAYWEAGGDLRGGRSHTPRPRYAAPKAATDRESVGMGDQDTYKELERWRNRPPSRGGPPPWLPKSPDQLGTDVAAILSQIDIPPARWKHVDMAFLEGGSVVVTITPKRGYDRVVILPDRSAAREFGRLIKDPASMARTRAEARRLAEEWRKRGAPIEVSTSGYRAWEAAA
jgi:hypothetical protein